MTRRMHGGATRRGCVWRASSLGAVAFAVVASLGAGTTAHADDDTVVVAVGLPPVPPDEVVVEVGLPPVPPASDVLGGEASGEVGDPPVPTLPDTGGDEPTGPSVDGPSVTSSIAAAVAGTASAAWHDE